MGEAAGFDVAAHLARIGHRGPVAPTAATLRLLHLAHLRAGPFENLDVWLRSPESGFTTGRICSLATATGRVTLAERRLIVTEDGRRTERELSEVGWRAALRSPFGIDLEGPGMGEATG